MLEKIGFNLLFAFANHGILNIKNSIDKWDLEEFVERNIQKICWMLYKS